MARDDDGSLHRSGHPRWALALIILGAILTFAAIFSIWVNRQALNTDNWVDTSTRLIQNEEVRNQLADYLANQLTANADIAGELEEALPPRLAPLATAAAGGRRRSRRRFSARHWKRSARSGRERDTPGSDEAGGRRRS